MVTKLDDRNNPSVNLNLLIKKSRLTVSGAARSVCLVLSWRVCKMPHRIHPLYMQPTAQLMLHEPSSSMGGTPLPRLILRSTPCEENLASATSHTVVWEWKISPVPGCQLALADSTRTVHTLLSFMSTTGDTLPAWCHERSAIWLIGLGEDDVFARRSSPSE